jgi:ribose transport system permease protein
MRASTLSEAVQAKMPERSGVESRYKSMARRQTSLVTPFALFAVLLAISGVRGPALFTANGLDGALIGAAPLVLGTLAITTIAIAGPAGVDLSIGPAMTLINIEIVIELPKIGVTGPVAVFACAIGLGILVQVVIGTIVALFRVSTVVVTLAFYLFLDGLNTVLLPEPAGSAPTWLANWGSESSLLSPVLYVLIGSFVLWALISRTTLFRNVRLMGADARTAFVSGVHLVPTRIGAHVIAGIFVGLASLMYTGLLGSADPTAGSSYTLSAVTALVIGGASLAGGRAKGLGAILGATDIWLISYVLGTFNFGLNASYWIEVATGGVLVVALLVGSFLASEDLVHRWPMRMFPGNRSR